MICFQALKMKRVRELRNQAASSLVFVVQGVWTVIPDKTLTNCFRLSPATACRANRGEDYMTYGVHQINH